MKSKIEYMPLEKIKRWERNPKDHDLGALHQSIDRFGFVAPLIIDGKNGKLVAGHGRLDALQQMKTSGSKPPKGIIVEKDSWLVPVREYQFKNNQEREAYSLADNRLVELGGYNEEQLAQVLSDLAASGEELLIGTGFDGNDIDNLLMQNQAKEKKKQARIALGHQLEDISTLNELAPHKNERQILEGKKFLIEFSGGKDSSATAIWAKHFFPDHEIQLCFCEMGADFVGFPLFLRQFAEAIDTKLTILRSQKGMIDAFLEKGQWPNFVGPYCHDILHKTSNDYFMEHNEKEIVIIRGGRAQERAGQSGKIEKSRFKKIDRMEKYLFFQPLYFTKKGGCEKIINDVGAPIWEGYGYGLQRTACRICPGQKPIAYAAIRANYSDVWHELITLEKIFGAFCWGKHTKGRKNLLKGILNQDMDKSPCRDHINTMLPQ